MWETKTLGEVCTFTRGLTYKKSDEVQSSKNVVLRANNISLERGELDFEELKYIRPDIDVPASKKLRFGSLLICTASGSKKHLGKIAYVDADYDYAFGGFMGLVTPNDEIDGKFLYRCMTSKRYFDFIQELSDGININNLKFSQLSDFNIPVPPLPEQKRIVAILDEVFEGIDAAIANTEKNLANARELFESYLNSIFTETSEGWTSKPLGDCFRLKSGDGLTSKAMVQGDYSVFGGNGIAGTHNEHNLIGDNVIIGRVGALCGNVRNIRDAIWLTDNAFKVVDKKFDFDNAFLTYLLNFKNLRNFARQSAQPVISNSSLKDLNLDFPESKTEQQKIVERLNTHRVEGDRLGQIYTRRITALAELKQSLLAKAFSGELTTQPDRVLKETGA